MNVKNREASRPPPWHQLQIHDDSNLFVDITPSGGPVLLFNESDTGLPGCSVMVNLVKMGESIRAQRRLQNYGGGITERTLASQPGVKASFLQVLGGENLSKYMMNFYFEFPHIAAQINHNNVMQRLFKETMEKLPNEE